MKDEGIPEGKKLNRKATATDLLRGLIYTHNRANANTAEVHEASATLHTLVEMLVACGLVDPEAFEEKRKQASERLRREYVERGMAVAMQEFGVSKYEFQGGAEIDCESRIHLCTAACCRLPFALSKQDVQEGIVKWDLGQPYMNARDADGYCTHLDQCSGRCTVYAQRPIPCRGYDCRKDKRIWLDFENSVINPSVRESNWPAYLETQTLAGVEASHGGSSRSEIVEEQKYRASTEASRRFPPTCSDKSLWRCAGITAGRGQSSGYTVNRIDADLSALQPYATSAKMRVLHSRQR